MYPDDAIHRLLKPGGRLARIAIKLSTRMPGRLMNPVMGTVSRLGEVDLERDVVSGVRAQFDAVTCEECFLGFYDLVGGVQPG